MKSPLAVALMIAACSLTRSQTMTKPVSVIVKADRLLDVRKGSYIEDAGLWIEGDRIREIGNARGVQEHAPRDARIVDLGHVTLLPGLIDCHTHLMARIPDGDNGYIVNLATKSEAFRALEGAYDARLTLEAGYTSVRDVENEGSGYADVALRDAIQQGMAEGPRMQVATRGIAAVGQYNPFGVSPDLVGFPTGAQMISGVEDARRAAREQIGHGADLIKVYADWHDPTLTVDEIRVIVEEAHKHHLRVAAHANTPQGILNAIQAGVDSIEHGHSINREDLELMQAKGIFLVPTLHVMDAMAAQFPDDQLPPARRAAKAAFFQGLQTEIQTALSLHVKIAAGSDASTPESQATNAAELAALTQRGMTPIDAIRAATINAAELLGWQNDVGVLEPGHFADIIAVPGDPLKDVAVLQHVAFVMKGGTIIRHSQHQE